MKGQGPPNWLLMPHLSSFHAQSPQYHVNRKYRTLLELKHRIPLGSTTDSNEVHNMKIQKTVIFELWHSLRMRISQQFNEGSAEVY